MNSKTKERLKSSLFSRRQANTKQISEAVANKPAVQEADVLHRLNFANNKDKASPAAGESALLRRRSLGLKAIPVTTQRPYRILPRHLEGIKTILRSINRQLPDDVPDITLDELGRIMHELFLKQEDHKGTVLLLRESASNPSNN